MAFGIFLVFLMAFSGNTIIMQYTALIFSLAGSSLPPNEAAIVLAAMQVLGLIIMGLLVDRIGRRKLMMISCVGSAMNLTSMAIYLLLKQHGYHLAAELSVFQLAMTIFFMSLGISSLLFVMCVEIVPFKVRFNHFYKTNLVINELNYFRFVSILHSFL